MTGSFVGLALLLSACSDGTDSTGAEPVDAGAATASTAASADQSSPDDGTPDGADDGANDAAGGGADGPTTGGVNPNLEDAVGPDDCLFVGDTPDPFRIVDGIPADDADGGLVTRRTPGGEPMVVDGREMFVAEGTVVAINCGQVVDGVLWVDVYDGLQQISGWVDARYLSADFPADIPTLGGDEVEAAVATLLDALAEERWEDAAAAYFGGDPARLEAALGAELLLAPVPPGTEVEEFEPASLAEVADGLARWCATRLCDTPYSVVEVRGSYSPNVRPAEVDVAFDYPSGRTVQTFSLERGPERALATLPHLSILAGVGEGVPGAADSVSDPSALSDEDRAVLAAADEVRSALLSESVAALASTEAFPADGVVDIEPDVVLTADDLLVHPERVKHWGYGEEQSTNVDTTESAIGNYRRSLALLAPDAVGLDQTVSQTFLVQALREANPDWRVVEFHHYGRGAYASFNWSSVVMAFENVDGRWELALLTPQTWQP